MIINVNIFIPSFYFEKSYQLFIEKSRGLEEGFGNRNRDGDPPLSLVNLKVMGRSKRKELSIMVKQ